MLFAPDTEEALDFAVALMNTEAGASRSGTDELATVAQLRALIGRYTYSGRIDYDEAELRAVRRARELLREVWTLDRDDAVEAVNRMLREGRALPYLARHDGLDWHLHATDPDAPLAVRMRVEAALALIDVIRMDETHRLRVCAASDCTGVFVDLSKNGSKRFCTVRCGNRMNMIAHRSRKQVNGNP
ncbi:CGNR zinc finger domain-containing protein [Catenuloplanes atrovinosus]|uniref:RNA-binding Zn ribbon-like protein n=1 Tax=Catenuloplanes atrovinosus TaxID=137266 RepID=A0AAE3YK47_9ACTN|nr:CGNR zinc finger domain-containing protein [Catenuloplanes atrovinosus]MDR7273648.1 putative RNA-binding Zn ribbon-like protein [Catenuloplanes atrovinosus]